MADPLAPLRFLDPQAVERYVDRHVAAALDADDAYAASPLAAAELTAGARAAPHEPWLLREVSLLRYAFSYCRSLVLFALGLRLARGPRQLGHRLPARNPIPALVNKSNNAN